MTVLTGIVISRVCYTHVKRLNKVKLINFASLLISDLLKNI